MISQINQQKKKQDEYEGKFEDATGDLELVREYHGLVKRNRQLLNEIEIIENEIKELEAEITKLIFPNQDIRNETNYVDDEEKLEFDDIEEELDFNVEED